MKELINRAIVLGITILCALPVIDTQSLLYIAIAGVIYSSYMYFYEDRVWHFFLNVALMFMILINSFWHPLIVLLFYDETLRYMNKERKDTNIFIVFLIILFLQTLLGLNRIVVFASVFSGMLCVFGTLIAVYLAYSYACYTEAESRLVELRDDSEEFKMLSEQKNILLRQTQDKELEVATLNERNRIAREIHDNVGHLLTRSIVMMGALQAVHKEEPLNSSLKQVSETLNESMMNIRQSVHDLHNEALDLRKAIRDILNKHNQYEYNFKYDVENESEVPVNVKYCLVSIITEALSNIEKHSDADKVNIFINEHPAFYQMIVQDNGHPARISESGIGIHNMTSRVEELKGRINFSIDNGFKIFLSIPKGDNR